MANKVNVANLLKNCPEGMELDCTMFDNLFLNNVNKDDLYPIMCYTICDGIRNKVVFTEFGEFNRFLSSKCVIFPKGKTTWEGFVPPCKFEDGDIVAFDTEKGAQLFIFKEYIHDHWYAKSAKCYMMLDCGGEIDFESGVYYVERLATEEEKSKLFDAIKEHGYKWNEETKTLEELIESKEDTDRVVMSGIYFDRENYADEVELHLGNYEIEIRDGKTYAVFKNQKNKTLKKLPKFKVGDRLKTKTSKDFYTVTEIRDDGYLMSYGNDYYSYPVSFCNEGNFELVHDKFDISTLKPFDKVLVRDTDTQEWTISFFSHCNGLETYKYSCINNTGYAQCIPYEGNEHLLGTTHDCDECYKKKHIKCLVY